MPERNPADVQSCFASKQYAANLIPRVKAALSHPMTETPQGETP